jgi:GMP synthase (glutamine-hydrolysing)
VSERVVIVNTHPKENPEFVGGLIKFMNSVASQSFVVEGYDIVNPLDMNPSHIILTGVPQNTDYSLTKIDTQCLINESFGWLRECQCPVLGICFGHQILAQIFRGKVSTLKRIVRDESLTLIWEMDPKSGIFSEVEQLVVFAEHKDYVSKIPEGFKVLCQFDGIPYIMIHPELEMYGLQFVPERSDESSQQVLKRFVDR